MKSYLLVTLVLISFLVQAQTLVNLSQVDTLGHPTKVYEFASLSPATGGDLILVYNGYATGTLQGIAIVKFDNTFSPVWEQYFNGDTNNFIFATGAYVKNGSVYVAGVIADSAAGNSDFYTMRMDEATGDTLWTASYAGSWGGYDISTAILADDTGNVYVTGTEQTGYLDSRITVVKYDSTGSQLFTGSYDSLNMFDGAVDMAFDPGKNVLVTGFSGTGFGSWDFVTAGFNPHTGVRHAYGRSANGNGAFSRPVAIRKDADNNLYVAGTSAISSGNTDLKLIKYDTLFHEVWVRTYGDSLLADEAVMLQWHNDNSLVLCGTVAKANGGTDMVILKYDLDGNLLWSRNIGAPDPSHSARANELILDDNQNVFISGNWYSGSDTDLVTASYSSDGDIRWLKTYNRGPGTHEHADGIMVEDNEVVVLITSTGAADTLFMGLRYKQDEAYIPEDTIDPNTAFAFYENRGQIMINDSTPADSVLFYTNAGNPQLYVSDKRISYVLGHTNTDSIPYTDTVYRIDMTLKGSGLDGYNIKKNYPDSKTNAFLNYFLGYLPGPITRVEGHNRVVRKGCFKDIDMHVCATTSGLKTYFVVEPNETISPLRMKYTGADSIRITNNRMTLYTRIGNIEFDSLVAYEVDGSGNIYPVTVNYDSTGVNEWKLNVAGYTAGNYLVVEQQLTRSTQSTANGNMSWSTYYGGSSYDQSVDVKTDGSNNAYITGRTASPNFPATNTATFSSAASYLVKFNQTGVRQYATYFGGASYSEGACIAINASNNVFVCGYSWDNTFPIVDAPPAFQPATPITPGTSLEPASYLARFNSGNGQITWSSYYSGNQKYIYFHNNNNLYMVGEGVGSQFPYTSSTTCSSATCFNKTSGSACISKFNSSLELTWATSFGASNGGTGLYGITTGGSAADMIYLVGSSENVSVTDFPIVGTGYSQTPAFGGGSKDGIIMKFDEDDNLLYSTYYGGDGTDELSAVSSMIISDGPAYRVFTTGTTTSSDFPTVDVSGSSHYRHTYGSISNLHDGVFVGLNVDNTRYYATYYGGSDNTLPSDIVCSGSNAYITGYITGSDLPIETPSGYFNQGTNAGNVDGFVARFSEGKLLDWSTYVGGVFNDESLGVAADYINQLYITGRTISSQSISNPAYGYPLIDPLNSAYFQPTLNLNPQGQGTDGFVTKFNLEPVATNVGSTLFDKSNLEIYPNPTSHYLYIKTDNLRNEDLKIEILDLAGRKVLTEMYKNEIDIGSLMRGMYFVKCSYKTKIFIAKFVKE